MGFTGGYRFRNFEGTAEPFLKDLPVPERISIDLADNAFSGMKALVGEGDTVKAGTTLLRSENDPKYCIPAPVNGKVTKITEKNITIKSDGSDSFEPVHGHTRAPWNLSQSELFDLFRTSGAWTLPDREIISTDDCNTVKHIVVDAVHNGPLDQAWSTGIFGDETLFPNGLKTLKSLFSQSDISIGINKRNQTEFSTGEIKEHASVHVLSDKYPQEHPELMVRDTVGKRFLSPVGIRDTSILVIRYTDVVKIAEVLADGRPLIDRILMVAGPGVSRPGWYRIRIGTLFSEIRQHLLKSDEHGPWRIVRGNLFTGEGIESLDVSVGYGDTEISVIREHAVRELWRFINPGFNYDSYTKSTIAEYIPFLPKKLDSNVHGGERPCVQCNACDEVCPVDIYPFLIWKYVEADNTEESFRFRPYDCVGCGLCDYVCPSKISVSAAVTQAAEEYHRSRRPDEVSD